MAKFNFNLQNFLHVREKLEEQKKMEFGYAIAEFELQKRKKAALLQERTDTMDAFKENMASRIDPTALTGYSGYVETLKGRITARQQQVEKASAFVEVKRVELAESMKNRKMIEKLKENQYETFQKEEMIAEQKQVDEVVSYRFNKN